MGKRIAFTLDIALWDEPRLVHDVTVDEYEPENSASCVDESQKVSIHTL